LDYDGTLTPIVKRPEDAVMSEDMRKVLKGLSSVSTLAIVSGRDRKTVMDFVKLDELIYAGSHGFDITMPGGKGHQHEDAKKALPLLDKIEKTLEDDIKDVKGAQVERKLFSIAVHYRNVDEKEVGKVEGIVSKVLKNNDKLKKGLGKKVIELQPNIEWHKGKAVLWLLKALKLEGEENIPLYVGDDITDENAFRTLQRLGLGILVGDHGDFSAAHYSLKDVDEVKEFLKQITELIRKGSK